MAWFATSSSDPRRPPLANPPPPRPFGSHVVEKLLMRLDGCVGGMGEEEYGRMEEVGTAACGRGWGEVALAKAEWVMWGVGVGEMGMAGRGCGAMATARRLMPGRLGRPQLPCCASFLAARSGDLCLRGPIHSARTRPGDLSGVGGHDPPSWLLPASQGCN